MRLKKGTIIAAAALLWSGCSTNSPSPTGSGNPADPAGGTLQVTLSTGDSRDAVDMTQPELKGIQHVWLTIKEVQVHTSGGGGWATVAKPNARFDFLVLVNGLTAPLKIYPLPAGKYTQIRLVLAEEMEENSQTGFPNEVVVDGKPYPLKVPSGSQSGIKCHHPFTIKEKTPTEICLEFDILKAIHYAPGQGYMMHPTYKMIECENPIVQEDSSAVLY